MYILGVSRKTSDKGAMVEVGWSCISTKAQQKALVQYIKYKTNNEKEIQNKITEMQITSKNSSLWANKSNKKNENAKC